MGVDFIEFPKLGIRLNVSPEAFELGPFLGIGPISVHWYGIIIATAILVSHVFTCPTRIGYILQAVLCCLQVGHVQKRSEAHPIYLGRWRGHLWSGYRSNSVGIHFFKGQKD